MYSVIVCVIVHGRQVSKMWKRDVCNKWATLSGITAESESRAECSVVL